MTDRQPNLKETKHDVAWAQRQWDYAISSVGSPGWGKIEHFENGFRYRYSYRCQGWMTVEYPYSDIEHRCELCDRILRDKYMRFLNYLFDDRGKTNKKFLPGCYTDVPSKGGEWEPSPRWTGGWCSSRGKFVCLSCYNKWRRHERAAYEAQLTAYYIRKTEREIEKCRRQSKQPETSAAPLPTPSSV